MKVPKEILKYLNYALGFCEERGLEEYERITEIIVENDPEKEFKYVHEELKKIRTARKHRKKEEPKEKDLGPCQLLKIYPAIFFDFAMLMAEGSCKLYFRFYKQTELLRFYSLMDKNGEFKRGCIRWLYEKKGHMLIHKFIVKKINKKRREIMAEALPTKGKMGIYWEII